MMNALTRMMPLEELIPAIEVDPNLVTPGVIGFVSLRDCRCGFSVDSGHGPQSPQGSLPGRNQSEAGC